MPFNLILLVIVGLLDIVLGGLLAYGLIRGLKNGLFAELGTFVSMLIGLFLASKFSSFTKTILSGHVSWSPTTIQISSFLITFVLLVVGISFLAKFLTSVTSFAGLGIVNTLAGGALGMLKTVLIVGVFMSLFEKVNINNFFVKKETLNKSLFYNPIQKTGALVTPVVESGLKKVKEKAL